ncbi:MAG: hypothetical protein ACJ8EW_05355 [Rhizobium sp.]|uniref:hypothetical protein n=1 Tax=Rhizobium TaxID=379 RepID=UPI0010307461|nr:hypothetical protein [Rhizobium leguminosarum]TAY18618.1 hypothetical protein ELH91_18405 [Rhizobium leguminosarum]
MVDITATLAVLGQAIGIAKDLREIDKGLDAGEFKAKMAELYGSLADVKMALADAQEELRAKDKTIAELRANFERKGEFVERHGYKYSAGPGGRPQGEPFCPRCEQNLGKFHRLAHHGAAYGQLRCPECKSDYNHIEIFLWDNE